MTFVPKMRNARNLWIQGSGGYYTESGIWIPERKFQGGSRRLVGGLEATIYQRVSRDAPGIIEALKIEGWAEPSGRIILRIMNPEGQQVWRSVSHRDGRPVE